MQAPSPRKRLPRAENGLSRVCSGALKIFVVITDDDSTAVTSQEFDTEIRDELAARFPGAPEQSYVFHAIIGMAAKPDGTIWQPDEPVQSATCTPGAQSAGAVYQRLSIATGGLRFPLCNVHDDDPSNDDFGTIISAIAAEAGAGPPRCSGDVPG